MASCVEFGFCTKCKMTNMTQTSEVTFSCPVSPASEKIETVGLEMVSAAVAPGQISQADSKHHSHYGSHTSRKQHEQKFNSPRNKWTFEIDAFVVFRIDKDTSELHKPSSWKAIVLDISKRQGERYDRRLMAHWFGTTDDREKNKLLFSRSGIHASKQLLSNCKQKAVQ